MKEVNLDIFSRDKTGKSNCKQLRNMGKIPAVIYGDKKKPTYIAVNYPKIVKESGKTVSEEGCLSVIDFRGEIQRSEKITLEFQDVKGKVKKIETEGMMSICLQHEIDHLNGILFIDHLPFLKQKIVKKRLSKLAKELV